MASRDQVADPVTGQVRLLSRPCDTCVTFPDDRMHLGERREAFISEVIANDSYVICHDTIGRADVKPTICRGFWNLHRDTCAALRLVETFGLAVEVDPPTTSAIDKD
jgi:hypothetical protein